MQGIDPSEAQLAFARTRPAARVAQFRQGDAMALPFPDDRFDAAVMALVIFFVPDPAKGVAEMARVVRPGGTVAAYAWDMPGGGFPLRADPGRDARVGVPAARAAEPRRVADGGAARACGRAPASRRSRRARSRCSGPSPISTTSGRPAMLDRASAPTLAAMSPGDVELLKSRVRARLPADAAGRITYGAAPTR